MNTKKYMSALALLIMVSGVAVALPASAQTSGPASSSGYGMQHRSGRMGMRPAAFGTVSAVNGDSITVTSTNKQTSATTTYTVDITNAKIMKAGTASSASDIAVGDTVAIMGTVSGTNITATSVNDGVMTGGMGMMRGNGVMGTVASISGDSITLTSQQWQSGSTAGTTSASTPVTYTVDATNATVTKDGSASSLSAIAVGDKLMVQGTVNGTSVTATKINDGMGMAGGAGIQNLPAGNGQPIIGGTITAISGTSVTVTNTAGVTYTVDASNAKFSARGVTSATISNLAVGDTVIVQGTVNGSAVTAASVIDQGAAPAASSGSTSGTTNPAPAQHEGFFGAIGGFFKHLFGF